jgi:Ca2+-binding EF-hand superfamily protein
MMQVGAGFIVGHIFNAHDQNEDGVLDKEEVAKMPAENREHARIAKADLNNDGVIEREELTATVQDD